MAKEFPPAGVKCLRCGADLFEIGKEQFRVGGTSGWKLLIGQWAETGEEMLELELLGCKECRYIELRLPAQ